MSEEFAPQKDYRLSKNIAPEHYDLTIWTDLQDLKFSGTVEISLRIGTDTSTVVLNSLALEFSEVSLHSYALQNTQTPSATEIDDTRQRVIFTFPDVLPANSTARLKIAFKADVSSQMMGYYRSTGGKDSKTVYALTQFQPTAARRAFPCWDEPNFKATFAITMISRKDTVNISNMPVAHEEVYTPQLEVEEGSWIANTFASLLHPSDWKITTFETTPPMSSYIIAYANGPFEYIESSYKSTLSGKVRPLRFYGTANAIPHAQFALDTVTKIMPIYEQMFDIEYPLPKLDIFAVDDFDLGGMENWGLVICRTQYLLHDPTSNDVQNQQSVASMVGHEVAHMWFGDITTMEWWDNLYLNEGFATLMGDKAILGKRVWPEWKPDSEFLGSSFFQARQLDAKLSSHPVEVECPNEDSILQIFDALSYAKAASVLRMLSSHVGEHQFLKGVSIYLKKHLYKNAVTKDLWEGIQAATNLDIPKIMDTWIKEMGYPVLTVTETEDGLHIRQDRFLETGPAEEKHNQIIWTVPLSILTVSDDGKPTVQKHIFDTRENFYSLETSKVFKLNVDTTGFYAVQYSPERLVRLGRTAALPDSPFSLSDRIGLVWDASALAKAGYAPVSSAFALIRMLQGEKEYFVWDTIATNIEEIVSTWYEKPQVVELLNAFRRDLFVPVVKRLGLKYSISDSPNDRLLRTLAVRQAAAAGNPEVVAELKAWYAHLLQTGNDSKIPSELQGVTFKVGVGEGGRPEWEYAKQLASNPKNPAQGVAALYAVGASKDLGLAEETFQFALTGVRDQDIPRCLSGLQQNPLTRKFLAERVKDRFDELEKRYAGTFNFKRFIEVSFRYLSSDKDYEATAAFLKDRDTAAYDQALRQSLDNIKTRAAWVKRSTEELTEWLKRRPEGER
ncbi:hypothetical protein BD310DRAFT_937381 [Dichomitus squalens]|uniref:Aminopeptidase n=1 Tax=Dichomitus squalens TaxID=114155 RepID=A0A4Q9PFP5_9APHY|nr:hypothetical protein BD310DRAFT_937381 [Dichomitus squalens]